MTPPVLVTGGTGRLGQIIVRALVGQGQAVRVLTRRPAVARSLFGDGVKVVSGDFGNPAALKTALGRVKRVLLLSPISETLADDQIALADAAVRSGAERIVKISGSDWTIRPTGVSISGDAHATVESHLRGLPLDHVAIRPNAWMQVGLAASVQRAADAGYVETASESAAVSYIDSRDIADIAVHQLLAQTVSTTPLVLTGPESLTAQDIAQRLARLWQRPITVRKTDVPQGEPAGFEERAVLEFRRLIAAGHSARVTTTVTDILLRRPRGVDAFLAELTERLRAPMERVS